MSTYIYFFDECYNPSSTPEEIRNAKLNELRSVRAGILTKTDWTQLPDVDLTPEQVLECRNYRDFIRRIPEIFPDLDNVVFPDPPSYLII